MSRPLSSREKNLATIVGTAAFLFANFLLVDWYWKSCQRMKADIASKTRQLQQMQTLTTDLSFWEQRHTWLHATQPTL